MQIIRTVRKLVRYSTGTEVMCSLAEAVCPECGATVLRQISNAKKSYSCGCWEPTGSNHSSYKHGKTPAKLYAAWRGMRERCSNPKSKAFHRYGGRGISVCEKWESDFTAFRRWALQNGWRPGLEVDRKDNRKGYDPQNCRIVTRAENCRNKTNNRLTGSDVEAIRAAIKPGKALTQIAKEYGVSSTMIYKIRDGKVWKQVATGQQVEPQTK